MSQDFERPPYHWIPTRWSALKIALGYAVVSAAWILCSGWMLHYYVRDPDLAALLENVKGWFFVTVTALLLGWVLNRSNREIRQSAQRLQESEQRWQYALEAAGDGVWDWDVLSQEVFYNDRWKRMLGYEPSEIGSHATEWERRVHPDDLPRVWEEIHRHFDGKTPEYACEYRLRCKDGAYKWILDRGRALVRAPDGKPLRLLGTHSDISKSKQAEEALRESEERCRGLIETTFDWIWEVDANARYTYSSPNVQSLLGFAPKEILGQTPFDLMPEAEANRLRKTFEQIAAKREPFSNLENVNIHKDGRLVVLETSGVPVLGPHGELRGYRGMDRDVTERKRL
jgi:PAS domain S-box-containing protein